MPVYFVGDATGVVGLAAPGCVFVIVSLPVIVVVEVSGNVTVAAPPAGKVPLGRARSVGVAGAGVAVGGALGGVVIHDLSGSIIELATT